MIYCVIPREWVPELYERMVAYYADNPDVTVIVDRREGPERRARGSAEVAQTQRRELRDRRRPRLVGSFPTTDLRDA